MQKTKQLLCVPQASWSTLEASLQQLVLTTIPSIVPDVPLIPDISSIDSYLLGSSMMFVRTVCELWAKLGKVRTTASTA